MKLHKKYIIACIFILGIFIYKYLAQEVFFSKTICPSGQYYVEVYYYRYTRFLPTFPGNSSLRGCIYVFDHTNKKIFRHELPLLSMGNEIRFYDDGISLPGLFFIETTNPSKIKIIK